MMLSRMLLAGRGLLEILDGELRRVVADRLLHEVRRGPNPRARRSGRQLSTTPCNAASSRSSVCSRMSSAVDDLHAPGVDDLALLVHDLVVLEDVLADLGVARLDGVLRPLDRLRSPSSPRWARPRAAPGPSPSSSRRWRTAASARPRATGRSATRPGRPGGRNGHGAGCRCAGSRAARIRARTDRRGRGPRRPRPCTRPRSSGSSSW